MGKPQTDMPTYFTALHVSPHGSLTTDDDASAPQRRQHKDGE